MEYQQLQQQQRQKRQAEESKQSMNDIEEPQIDVAENENENKQSLIEERINKSKEKLAKVSEMCANCAKSDLIKVAVRLPDGRRAEYTFCKDNTVESLFDFVNTFHLKTDDKYIE